MYAFLVAFSMDPRTRSLNRRVFLACILDCYNVPQVRGIEEAKISIVMPEVRAAEMDAERSASTPHQLSPSQSDDG